MSDELLVSRSRHVGAITLNRPEALNSLTLGMLRGFARALDEFAHAPEIFAVVVKGAGERGLCAGGDIRGLYETGESDRSLYKTFWREEYELDARIASFPKPYLAMMDGIVMGGGVGITAHGNCRVVTERTRLAMPETGIGFIPDTGGTWLLTRRGGAGRFVALSGEIVGPADAIFLGLADYFLESHEMAAALDVLMDIERPDDARRVMRRSSRDPGPSLLAEQKDLLDWAMERERVEDILGALIANRSSFALQAARNISSRSPLSVKLTHELLKKAAAAENLEACLVNEYRAACALLGTHDLYEGIRAAIIDKDRTPFWSPATLAEVDDAFVAKLLAGTGDPEPRFSPWDIDAAPTSYTNGPKV